MKDCIFCKIANSSDLTTVVMEAETVVAFKSNDPVSEVHLLIVPKKHIDSFMDIHDEKLLREMKEVAQKLIVEHGITDAYKLLFNGGKYQSVKHVHWHLLGGRFKNDQDSLAHT